MDVGELGWSMYIAAHVRWYKEKTNERIAIMTYPDRRCLYEGLVDVVMDLPAAFYLEFDVRRQNCLGIQEASSSVLKNFLSAHLTDGYRIPDYFVMSCNHPFEDKLIFKSYEYSRKIEGPLEILVFPRYREGGWYSFRNLSQAFYLHLIARLCDEFPQFKIRTIGTEIGAYDININKTNYINWVEKSDSLQDMIDRCQIAVAAVGSQSGPPKIALFQGVPTFMIGHQKQKHVQEENWAGTKVEFHNLSKNEGRGLSKNKGYKTINIATCVEEAVEFVKSNKRMRNEQDITGI